MSPPKQTRPRVVTLVQPSLHQYRIAFFEQLIAALAAHRVRLRIWYGAAAAGMHARGDSVQAEWARPAPTLALSAAGRRLTYHRLGPAAGLGDLVIAEQAIRNLETYRLLLRAGRGGPPVAFWGHGSTMTKPHSRLERQLKNWMTAQAHWAFTYTEGGARQLSAQGFPAERITVVHNTVDTAPLQQRMAALDPAEVDSFRDAHGLRRGRTALFLGGLDAPKRLDVLAAACRRIQAELPGFRLLVAGAGEQQGYVRALTTEGWLVYFGPVFGADRAVLGAVSDIMLMPGRVGLSVVDAFALGTPLLTTDWPYHAPEVEYLDDGTTGLITPDRVEDFAAAAVAVLRDPARLARMQAACRKKVADYDLTRMVRSFRDGVLAALSAGSVAPADRVAASPAPTSTPRGNITKP